jgi:hypothetical protein
MEVDAHQALDQGLFAAALLMPLESLKALIDPSRGYERGHRSFSHPLLECDLWQVSGRDGGLGGGRGARG